jgi:AmmeMemoRadiSam system protein B
LERAGWRKRDLPRDGKAEESSMMTRQPAVAGTFYEKTPERLWMNVEEAFRDNVFGPGQIPSVYTDHHDGLLSLIVPHAGHMYSGPCAARAYARLAASGVPATVVLIGPNHQGNGTPFAAYAAGKFSTPLGDVEIDEEFMAHFMFELPYFEHDPDAHQIEHSLEVQLPFLQYLFGSRLRIAPLLVSIHPFDSSEDDKFDEIADVLAECVETHGAVLIATTDLSHYHPIDLAKQFDRIASRAMLTMDGRRLLATVREYEISMCGAIPAALALMASVSLNAKFASTLSYYTSGDVDHGDPERVVGYTSIEICR